MTGIILVLIGLLIIILGFAAYKLKWHFLISGYNTLTKEAKEKVDVEGLAKTVANYSYSMGALFILAGGFAYLQYENFMIPFIFIVILLTFFMVFKTQKFMKDAYRTKTSKKASIIIPLVILVGVGIFMIFDLQETKITVNDGELDIGGIYGDTFRIKDLENIELVDKLPAIEMRTNGSALGSHLKGHFRLASKEEAVLFVNTKYPPFVKFTYNGKLYYFNQADADRTKNIYNSLLQ